MKGDALMAVAIILGLLLLFLQFLKARLMQGIPESAEFRRTNTEEHPGLDLGSLNRYDDSLRAIGFEPIIDYTSDMNAFAGMSGFARLYRNAEEKCVAEISEMFRNGITVSPFKCVIESTLDQDWSLSTTNRVPDGGTWVIRKPKSLWTSHPGLAPADLLRVHLQMRRKMTDDLGVVVLPAMSAEEYFVHEDASLKMTHELMKRKSIFTILWEYNGFKSSPKYEWMGDYAPIAARRSAFFDDRPIVR